MIKQAENHGTGTNFSFSKSVISILRSVVFAYIFLIICFAVLALVYTYTDMSETSLNPWVTVISSLALIAGGFTASKRVNTMGYLHGAVSGLMCSLIRILSGIAVFGQHISDRGIVPTLIFGTLIAAIGGIVGVNASGRKRKKKHK